MLLCLVVAPDGFDERKEWVVEEWVYFVGPMLKEGFWDRLGPYGLGLRAHVV